MRTIKIISFMSFTVTAAIVFLLGAVIVFPWLEKVGPILLSGYSRVALAILRVRIEAADKIPSGITKDKSVILVANHVSMMDILLMSALYRTVFLSKEEVKHYPLIGLVARLIGIVFLKRESPFDRHRVIRKIARHSNGRTITIFPQGTTSPISERLPFKRGIFKAVEINPEALLLPVTIRYKEDGAIAWRRDQILIDNLKTLCDQKAVHVKVTIHEPMSIEDFEDKSVSEVCSVAEQRVFSRLLTDY